MNDSNKRIDVNISSLLSLKAELLRKQEEVSKAKTKQSFELFIPHKKLIKSNKNENSARTEQSINIGKSHTIIEYENSALLDKSRKALEAKSRFYEKMIASGGSLNSDDNCLVLFNQKKQHRSEYKSDATKDSSNSSSEAESDNEDEEWAEYTDCLGRTRKCLRKDLEFFKKKDSQLAENIQPRIELNQNAPMWMIDIKGSESRVIENEIRDDVSEMTSVLSKYDQMKTNWEKKEEENIYKENVHYQDVLFDEARQHGVGYYAFSTDEEERAKQRKALDELREKTLAEQKYREAQRAQRKKVIEERVKAAKNRQRARLGLPPLEDEPEPTLDKLYDNKVEEKRIKKKEKERRKKEKQEKFKEEERKKHVRPWDKNKDGVSVSFNFSVEHSSESDEDNWKYKPEREPMSQEQWNEMKRNERNMEFAPVQKEMAKLRPSKLQPSPSESLPTVTLRSFRSQPHYFSYDSTNNIEANETLLYFTTKKPYNTNKNKECKQFIKRNYSSVVNDNDDEKLKIATRNKLGNDYNNDGADSYDDRIVNQNGNAEVPPPEYYGSSITKRSKLQSSKPDVEQSIEAGLRFLRDHSDKGILPVKSSWTANASNADC